MTKNTTINSQPSMVNLIYLTFGHEQRNHLQVYFSVLTFLSQSAQIEKIFIVTDQPAYYQKLSHEPLIKIVPIVHSTLKEWEGTNQFFWRVKIKCIESLIIEHPSKNWLYLDSDTFLYGTIERVIEQLNAGKAFMHLKEGDLSKLTSKTEKSMWRFLKGQSIGGIATTAQHAMWNAGVVGLPAQHAQHLIADILAYCDALCATAITRRLVEQYAFSVVLSEQTQLLPCDDVIGHYWGNKPEWNKYINQYFLSLFMQDTPLETAIKHLPQLGLGSLPVYKKEPLMYRRLKNLLEKSFKSRKERYALRTDKDA